MEGSSKDCGGGEARTRSQKRRREEEEEATRKQRRLEQKFLQPRKDKVLRPTDLLVDTALRKVKIPADEEEVKVEVKLEPNDAGLVEDVMEGPEELKEVDKAEKVQTLQAKVKELTAKVASLEAQLHTYRQLELNKMLDQVLKSWDPIARRLHLRNLPLEEYRLLDKIKKEFVGVSHLQVDMMKSNSNQPILPDFFEGLKHLKLCQVEGPVDTGACIKACLAACKNLETFTVPQLPGKPELAEVVEHLRELIAAKAVPLKNIDFEMVTSHNHKPDADDYCNDRRIFQNLIRDCAEHRVGISNMCTRWPLEPSLYQPLGHCVQGLTMDGPSSDAYVWDLDLELMDSLTITGFGGWINGVVKQPKGKWTQLSKVDIRFINCGNAMEGKRVRSFCHVLVEQSPNLKELRVKGPVGLVSLLLEPALLRQLRHLTLYEVRGKHSILDKSWPELLSLEQLTIDGSAYNNGIYDTDKPAFWGEWASSENSTFLQMKNLRKLSLKRLDQMKGIKDEFFRQVVSRMQLSHLEITSEKPISRVTRAGIESLLTGAFAQSIQEFPFEGWSLDKVSQAEFQELGKRFRCNND